MRLATEEEGLSKEVAMALSQEMLDIRIPIHAAMRQAAFHLNEVYSAL